MDYYFSAPSDAEALKAKDGLAGPTQAAGFDSVEAKGVMAPALEELVAVSKDATNALVMARALPLWPETPANPEDYTPGPSLTRLPDGLRDDLAELDVTASLAIKWAGELYGYEPADAQALATRITLLARSAKDQDRSIYWWSEM